MSKTDTSPQANIAGFSSNAFGDRYLHDINQTAFTNADANSVFRSFFGDTLFEKNTFYIITGTDSGLLYQHIKTQGIPDNSRYLFVELPQVLSLLDNMEEDSMPGLAVTADEDWLKLADEMEIQKYTLLQRVVMTRSLAAVHAHHKPYASLWKRLSEEFNELAWQLGITLSNEVFLRCQLKNLTENQVPALCLKDIFQGKTAVVLAGGPSLNDLLPWVREHRNDLLVIAVSRISRSLLQADVQPDICVSVDPTDLNIGVSREMLEFQAGTLLVNKYHLSPGLLSSWKHAKVFIGERYPWPTPLEPENLAEPLGATVTNTALGIALDAGATQIILGGADFCFSQEGYTHATGSSEHAAGSMPQLDELRVKTNDGQFANTTNAFQNSAIALSTLAQEAQTKGCRIINPAPGAMALPNVAFLPLDGIHITPLEQPANEVLAGCLPPDNAAIRIETCEETLGEVGRVLTELKSIKDLSNKALKLGQKLLNKGSQQADLHEKSIARIENQLYGKHVNTTTFIKHFGLQSFVQILGPEQRNAKTFEHTSQLYFQAFVDNSSKLIKILYQARSRILSRIEEEKPRPDVMHLSEQWLTDQLPGRADYWLHRHADLANQLTDSEQQALRRCHDAFETQLGKINRIYVQRLEQYAALDGIPGKAGDFFRCHDPEGLRRLLSTLRSHKKPDESSQFIYLVKGYLADLNHAPTAAIEAYRKVLKGPALTDASTRLFALYSETGDQAAALETLRILSSENPAYLPLLADMLHATGDTQTAADTYTNYLLDHPDDLDAMMKLGKIFLDAGSAEGVSWTMGYILDKDPEHQAARQLIESLTPAQANN